MHCVEAHAKMLRRKENLLTELQDKLDSLPRTTLTGMNKINFAGLPFFVVIIDNISGWWETVKCSVIMTTIYYSQSNGVIIMSTANTYVRARIDTATKIRAGKALNAMGLTVSDAIRLLMLRIADEHRLPFEIKVPNAETRKSIVELESGKGKKFASVNGLMKDINAVD